MDTPIEAKNTPRDFFLYLFATAAIYFIAINTTVLLWQYINYFFPDPVHYGYFGGFSGAMRFSLAALIIVFPAYIWVMRFLGRDIDKNPEKKNLWIRRWLIYITLFISAAVVIGDLVSLLYTFLGGDLAIRFSLKALAVLLVAGAVFWYYLFNLKREPGTKAKARRNIIWVVCIFMAAVVIGAFFIIGSPQTNRLKNFDLRRVSDLQSIQWQIISYWQQKQFLPATLADLEDPLSGFVVPKDPQTSESYEYNPSKEDLAFELCATFALESANQISNNTPRVITPAPFDGEFETPAYWEHKAGRTCFSRTIDPDRYPPFSKPIR